MPVGLVCRLRAHGTPGALRYAGDWAAAFERFPSDYPSANPPLRRPPSSPACVPGDLGIFISYNTDGRQPIPPPGWPRIDSGLSGGDVVDVRAGTVQSADPVLWFDLQLPIRWRTHEVIVLRGADPSRLTVASLARTSASTALRFPAMTVPAGTRAWVLNLAFGRYRYPPPSGYYQYLPQVGADIATCMSTRDGTFRYATMQGPFGPGTVPEQAVETARELAFWKTTRVLIVEEVPQNSCPEVLSASVSYGSLTRTGPRNPTWTISAAASDADRPPSLRMELRTGTGGSGSLVASWTASSPSYYASAPVRYDAPGMAEGTRTLYLTAWDGICRSRDLPVTVRRDDRPPHDARAWASEAGPSRTYSLTLRATDALSTDPSELRWRLLTPSGREIASGRATSGVDATAPVSDPYLVDGPNRRLLEVTDGAGNERTIELTVTARLAVNMPPTVGPVTASYSCGTACGPSSDLVLSIPVGDPDGGTLTVEVRDGSTRLWSARVAAGSVAVARIGSAAFPPGPDGPRTLTVTASDGSLTASASVTVLLDRTPPQLSPAPSSATWASGGWSVSGTLSEAVQWRVERPDGAAIAAGSAGPGPVTVSVSDPGVAPGGTTQRRLVLRDRACAETAYQIGVHRAPEPYLRLVPPDGGIPMVRYWPVGDLTPTRQGPNAPIVLLNARLEADAVRAYGYRIIDRSGAVVSTGAYGGPVWPGMSVTHALFGPELASMPGGTIMLGAQAYDPGSSLTSNVLWYAVRRDPMATGAGSWAEIIPATLPSPSSRYSLRMRLVDDLSTDPNELRWELRAGTTVVASGRATSGATLTFPVIDPRLARGENRRTLRWLDGALNPVEIPLVVNVEPENLPPTISSASVRYRCGAAAGPRSTPMEVIVRASDPEGAPLTARVTAGGRTLAEGPADRPLRVQWNAAGLTEGENELIVTVTDGRSWSAPARVTARVDAATVGAWYSVGVGPVSASGYDVDLTLRDDHPWAVTWSWEEPSGRVLASGAAMPDVPFRFRVREAPAGDVTRVLRMRDSACNEAIAEVPVRGAAPAGAIGPPPRPPGGSYVHDPWGDVRPGADPDQPIGGVRPPHPTVRDRFPPGRYVIVRRPTTTAGEILAAVERCRLRGVVLLLRTFDGRDVDWAGLRLPRSVVLGGLFELGPEDHRDPVGAAATVSHRADRMGLDAVLLDVTHGAWALPRSGHKLLSLVRACHDGYLRPPEGAPGAMRMSPRRPTFVVLPDRLEGREALLSADGVLEVFANGHSGPGTFGMYRSSDPSAPARAWLWARPWSEDGRGIGRMELVADVRGGVPPGPLVDRALTPGAVSVTFPGQRTRWTPHSGIVVYDDLDGVARVGCGGRDPVDLWDYDGLRPLVGGAIPVYLPDPPPRAAVGRDYRLEVRAECWKSDEPVTRWVAEDPGCPSHRRVAGSWILLNGRPVTALPAEGRLPLVISGRPRPGDEGQYVLHLRLHAGGDHLASSAVLSIDVSPDRPGDPVGAPDETLPAGSQLHPLHPSPAGLGRAPDYWVSADVYCAGATAPSSPPPPPPPGGAPPPHVPAPLVGCPTPPGLELTADCEWHRWFEGILAIDIGGPVGTPLYSVCDGVVTYRGFDPRYPTGEACVRYLFGRPTGCGYGYMVDVRCDDGRLARYGHLASPAPVGASAVGDRVARGQVIGLMGNTGYSSGPHLHLEIREGRETLCPLPLIPPGCVV